MKSISTLFRQLFLIVVLISAFSLSAWGETTVEMTTFSATSASMDDVISYSTAKGGGTSNPAINSGEIRLYQNSAGTGGGYITITAKKNYTISSVTIGSSMATSVAHTIGSSTTKSSKSSLAKNGKHTISDINDQSVTIYCMGTTSSSRLYVNYLSVTYAPIGILEEYTITWMNGTESYETTTYTEGQPLILPAQNPESCSDNYSTFVGWYTQQAGPTSNPSTELQGTEASKTDITGPTTFYAVFGDANGTSIPTESSIDFSKQGYGNGATITSCEIGDAIVTFNNGSNSNSPTYYTSGTAIRAYGGNNFTISSETTISSITITFGSSDGSNAITTDCGTYSGGTWTGSANSVKFTIGGSSGNRRIQKISVTTTSTSSSAYISTCDGEEVINPDAPTFNPAGGNFTETQSVEISAEDGAMIYYTTNGDDPTTESILYNGAIEVSTTTTIKAIAVLNGVESGISTTEYRINIVDDIAAFIEKQPTVETKILGTVTVVAQDQWKQRTWIQDANGSAMIDNSSKDVELTFGDQLKGIVGTFISNNINVTSLPEKEATTATPTTKETKTIGEITTSDLHKYIRIENVTFGGINGSNATFTDETNSIKTYESYLQTDYSSINEGQKVNLNAIVGVFNNVPQIYVVSFDVVREPAIYADDIVNFGDVIENNESTKTITITTVDLGGSASVSISGANASCFAVNPTSIEDNSETEITITFTAPDVDVEIECTATLTITGGGQTKEIELSATVKPLLALTANINANTQNVGTFAEGDDITTALEAIDVTAPEGWSFVGWVANAINGSQTTTPEYLKTMPAETTTAYAVFKLGKEVQTTEILNGSSATYAKNSGYCDFTATSASGIWTGKACYNTKDYLQINKNSGNYHIGSPIFTGNVTSLKITTTNNSATNRTFYICSSDSTAQPTSGDLGQHTTTTANEEFTIDLTKEAKQFYIYSSGAVYISKIEITYIEASDILYRTSVSSLVVTNNDTETISEDINSLTLYVDKTPNTQLEVTETITADKVTVIQTIDASRWFFFSLPFDCKVADIVATYVNGGDTLKYAPDASTGDYVIAKYNGGWVELTGTSDTLKANQGYIIGHFESGDVTVKFPSNGAQNISAPANATLAKTSVNRFNLIGLPYFQKVTNVGLNTMYVSIPNEDGTYTQEVCNAEIIASIAPFTSFFVQTEDENIEFTLGAQQNAAPMLRANGVTNKAVVTLTDANGGADKTTIINNPSKTTDYEIGHDLTKLIGYAEIPQIYSLQGDEMLAFNSLAIDNSTVIPLGVYAHADGDYTFSLSEKSIGDLQGWELYDNETGKTTRLANEDLTIYLEQGTHEGRFEIRLQQRITTDCDNAMGDMTTWTANGTLNIDNMPADAVVYIYDAVGRMIYVATPNATTFNYNFVARGVYNIVVRSADNTVSFKTIY